MGNANLLASAVAGLVGIIDPDAYTANTYTTDWIAAKDFHSYLALISAGTLGASATLDAKFEQATDGSGTGAKDIDGKSITQFTQAGGDSDKQAIINLYPDELDVNNDFTHFRLSLTIAAASSDAGAHVFGLNARYGEASDNDVASVAEIVS